MKSKLSVLGVCLLAFAPASFAGTSFKGGDPVALEFQNSAEIAISEVEADLADYPEVKGVDLNGILASTKIMVSSSALYVDAAGVNQESAAVNSRKPDTIIVNDARWAEIDSQEVKNALALHEVLGLAGIEDTGSYAVSSKYLTLRGISCSPDQCSILPIDVGSFSSKKPAPLLPMGTDRRRSFSRVSGRKSE